MYKRQLSNFAATAFTLDKIRYESVEGFWQMMKFPENSKDIRHPEAIKTPYSRNSVQKLTAFKAKEAGDAGNKIMKTLKINWVTYQSKKMTYRTSKKLTHYHLIKRAMRAKLQQNPKVKKVLQSTGELTLLPDHHTFKNPPPAWEYYKIWMELREEFREDLKKLK